MHATSLRRLLGAGPLRSQRDSCVKIANRFLVQASSSDNHSSDEGGRDPPNSNIDTSYQTPTEKVWPASRQQQKFASRLHRCLMSTLLEDDHLRDALVQDVGLSVKEVRMSPDNSKAFVLWASYNGRAAAAERELKRCLPNLKAGIAKRLASRNMPRLEFRADKSSNEEDQLEEILQRLELERQHAPKDN